MAEAVNAIVNPEIWIQQACGDVHLIYEVVHELAAAGRIANPRLRLGGYAQAVFGLDADFIFPRKGR